MNQIPLEPPAPPPLDLWIVAGYWSAGERLSMQSGLDEEAARRLATEWIGRGYRSVRLYRPWTDPAIATGDVREE